MGWYGADVTPQIFYENFIEVMVNIDANDRTKGFLLVAVMIQSSDGRGAGHGDFYTVSDYSGDRELQGDAYVPALRPSEFWCGGD